MTIPTRGLQNNVTLGPNRDGELRQPHFFVVSEAMKMSYRLNLVRLAVLLAAMAFATSAQAATSITQYGITWTFSADKTVGQYANGDYYVVGPVTITNISPKSTLISGRTMHGSMVNPTAKPFAPNGFDSTLRGGGYSPALNVARPKGEDLSAANPLVLPAGSSLISSVSFAKADNRPQLTDAAVLTVVTSAPPPGSFRPPYCGTDKTPYWNKSSLDYSILKSLPIVAGTPDIALTAKNFERPWIEIDTQYTGREWHPQKNQPMYGRDMANQLGGGLLLLHLNYTQSQKELLYMRLVQYGIDIYGAALTGGNWQANGGHDLGRKMPLILAGLALNEKKILAYADAAKHMIFQEDQQTFYVSAKDVGLKVKDQSSIGRERLPYTSDMIGLPEWGIEHISDKLNDGSNWGTVYRDVNYPPFTMHALAAHLTEGARAAWNWSPFFDYVDRAKSVSDPSNYLVFTLNMWAKYRTFGAPVWTAIKSTEVPSGATIKIDVITP